MQQKTIIALWGRSNVGKTQTIVCLYNIFCAYPNVHDTLIPAQREISAIITLKSGTGNITIGFESQGDPNTDIESRLEQSAINSCDIIVCASRTRGDTAYAVEDIAKKYGYRIVWVTNFASDILNHAELNKMSALNIENLIMSLITKNL